MIRKAVFFALLWFLHATAIVQARDFVSIVGSSTVYPFAKAVAQNVGNKNPLIAPRVESTGSGGGFQLFCAGAGADHPDIANASRRIMKSEYDQCLKNGVTDLIEVKIGYDGIVLANAKTAPQFELNRKDIFLAIAKNIPTPDGTEKLVPNPFRRWEEVNPSLPSQEIKVLGPPPTSGTRDAFEELAMEGGCRSFPWVTAIKKRDKDGYLGIWRSIRADGVYMDAGENDNLIVKQLLDNNALIGIFGFSYLAKNSDKIQGAKINGYSPSFASIASNDYPLSRPLFFYVKKQGLDVVPGLTEYLAEFTSDSAWGNDGYLVGLGLIPMSGVEREEARQRLKARKCLQM